MSTLLGAYHKGIDESNFDVKNDKDEISSLLKDFTNQMTAQNDTEGLKYLRLEKDLFFITKSTFEGLTPTMQQTKQTADGKTVEVSWPDFGSYGQDECDYFEKRYLKSQNLFFKTEYGLLLFLMNRLRHNQARIELINNLIDLAKQYKSKILSDPDGDSAYSYPFNDTLTNIIGLFVGASSLQTEFETFVKLLQNWFYNWPVNHNSYLSFTYFITQVFSENKKKLQNKIEADKILVKLEEGMNFFASSNLSITISISEKTVLFCSAFKPNYKKKYILQLAYLYEADGDAQVNTHPVGAIKCYENALSWFDDIKELKAIDRVSKKYEANKGKFEMGTISVETDKDTSATITKFINDIVDKKSSDLILSCLCGYQIIGTAKTFKEHATKSSNSNDFTNYVSLHSLDKYGNTLRVYSTKEEREFYHLANIINLSHQTSSQMIFQILWRSLKAGFFSYDNVKAALEKSWLNQSLEWLKHGKTHAVIPLEAILPGIKNFFEELNQRLKDESYIPDFILCTDSLATKIEMILRYISKNAGIPTFRYMQHGEVILTDEKTLGMLLQGLEGVLEEDDTILITHLINEKGGLNIRNRISHGLVDAKEYSPILPLTLIGIILRLSQYGFEKTVSYPDA